MIMFSAMVTMTSLPLTDLTISRSIVLGILALDRVKFSLEMDILSFQSDVGSFELLDLFIFETRGGCGVVSVFLDGVWMLSFLRG